MASGAPLGGCRIINTEAEAIKMLSKREQSKFTCNLPSEKHLFKAFESDTDDLQAGMEES